MTDFHAQLERQLVDAGRRRAVRGGWRRAAAGRGRLAVAACAVVLVLAAGGAVVPGLFDRSGSATEGGAVSQPAPLIGAEPAPIRSQSLRGIGVSVLNATTTTGLARTVADLLERRGATILEIRGASDQSLEDTIVSYAGGAKAPAHEVAAVLGVDDVTPFSGTPSMSIPTGPSVLVLVGRDRIAP